MNEYFKIRNIIFYKFLKEIPKKYILQYTIIEQTAEKLYAQNILEFVVEHVTLLHLLCNSSW